jgi:hypothetical protein
LPTQENVSFSREGGLFSVRSSETIFPGSQNGSCFIPLIANMGRGYLHQQSTWEVQLLVSLPEAVTSYSAGKEIP